MARILVITALYCKIADADILSLPCTLFPSGSAVSDYTGIKLVQPFFPVLLFKAFHCGYFFFRVFLMLKRLVVRFV